MHLVAIFYFIPLLFQHRTRGTRYTHFHALRQIHTSNQIPHVVVQWK